MLGAYYYIWYGRPTLSIIGGGVWRWGYTNHPALGEYNHLDKEVISRHIDWSKAAGIDFWAVRWVDSGSWDDIALKDHFLSHPRSSEMKFCINYDAIPALNRYQFHTYPNYDFDELYTPQKTKGDKFLEDFDYLAKTYFNLPQYLKIEGKPVVILYNASAYRNMEKYFAKLPPLFLIADAVCWAGARISKRNLNFLWETSPKEAVKTVWRAFRRNNLKNYENDIKLSKHFRAITGYNMYSQNRLDNFLENVDGVFRKFHEYAKSQNLHFVPNVMPGYDDRNQNGLRRLTLGRKAGEFYKDYWRIAKKYLDPDLPLVLLTTFNEWHEGTEIEPSREYGEKYIELTKQLSN